MNGKLKNAQTDFFYKAVLALQTPEECARFFEDICTIQEMQSICQRLRVAQMLAQQCVYSEIVEATGASTTTISRVNRSLNYGSDGYRLIFERLGQEGEVGAG